MCKVSQAHPTKRTQADNDVKAMAELQEKWIEETGVTRTQLFLKTDMNSSI